MEVQNRWQSGPTELIRYAIKHLHRSSEFDQRIAFLLLDVGVETLFKTFLQLPEEATGTKMSYGKRRAAAEGNFHELVRGVKEAAGTRLDGIDLTHVQFYHDLRNKLYHQGNGITVPTDKSKGYASLAAELLRRLLDIDLQPELLRPQQESKRRQEENAIVEQVRQMQEALERQMRGLEQDLRLAIEKVEPAFVMPSFERRAEQWQSHSRPKLIASLYLNTRKPDNASFDAEDLLHEWPSELLSEVRQLMPPALQRFIDDHHVGPGAIAKMALESDFLEVLLILADIALGLPTDPSDDVYWQAKTFQSMNPLNPPPLWEAGNSLERMLREGEDLKAEVDKMRSALTVSIEE